MVWWLLTILQCPVGFYDWCPSSLMVEFQVILRLKSILCDDWSAGSDQDAPAPSTIRVDGVNMDMDLELLEFYFDSPKNSGGDQITNIVDHRSQGYVLVTFEDPAGRACCWFSVCFVCETCPSLYHVQSKHLFYIYVKSQVPCKISWWTNDSLLLFQIRLIVWLGSDL